MQPKLLMICPFSIHERVLFCKVPHTPLSLFLCTRKTAEGHDFTDLTTLHPHCLVKPDTCSNPAPEKATTWRKYAVDQDYMSHTSNLIVKLALATTNKHLSSHLMLTDSRCYPLNKYFLLTARFPLKEDLR